MRIRGFEIVKDEFRKHKGVKIELPVRQTKNSAGYDIKTPVEVVLQPNERQVVFTDIKAYMQHDEVLELHIRSSVGTKDGVILSNGTGIIDSDYYNNVKNDGNIGLPLWNTSDKVVTFEAGERLGQLIFKKYLTIDNDSADGERKGGFGSTSEVR